MKTKIRTIAMAIVLVIAGSSVINAQRGMGRMMNDSIHKRMLQDTAFMKRQGRPMMQMRNADLPVQGQFCPGCGMGMRQGFRPGWGQAPAGRIRHGAGWGPYQNFRGGMAPGRGFRGDFGPRQFNRPGFTAPQGPARIENIPNLTDKQKKELQDLRLKQIEEIRKLRDESAAKMKSLREDHRKKVLGLLSEEQKKFMEGNPGVPPADVKKQQK